MECHRKIDPFGVVFENYDAVGGSNYLFNDKLIDAKSELPDGSMVEGIDGIKDYILDLREIISQSHWLKIYLLMH